MTNGKHVPSEPLEADGFADALERNLRRAGLDVRRLHIATPFAWLPRPIRVRWFDLKWWVNPTGITYLTNTAHAE